MRTDITLTPGRHVATPDGPGVITDVDAAPSGVFVKVALDRTDATARRRVRYHETDIGLLEQAWQRREIAWLLIYAAANLVESWDEREGTEGLDRELARTQIARWLVTLPGADWDIRLDTCGATIAPDVKVGVQRPKIAWLLARTAADLLEDWNLHAGEQLDPAFARDCYARWLRKLPGWDSRLNTPAPQAQPL